LHKQNTENPKTEVIKLKISDTYLELRPLTIIIGKTVEKSFLLSQLASAITDAVFLPADRACRAFSHPIRLTKSAEELLRGVGIVLRASPSAVYIEMNGRKIELAHVPPSIRGIVAIVLALSSKNRFVIIEDPEAHLHPSAQRILARVIAEAVNSGLYVILTTHSDYLISELNNLIALSASIDVRKKLGYRDVEVISPEMVAVYHLVDDGGKVVAKRLSVDYTGIPEDEFAKVAEEILAMRNELY